MSQSPDSRTPSLARTSTRGSLLDVPSMEDAPTRPQNVSHVSTPSYESPLRHHRRQPSTPRHVKETLHARSEYTNSEDDGAAIHRINQYIIKQEVGRGSFGAVHLAVDQYGNEYAVKEFSKSRLRKRAQSSILRRPGARTPAGHLAAGGINTPLHRRSASDIHKDEEQGNPLYLIREEIAIMKKLNHPNLVSLLEVLDDPAEDSLYMVLEMCKKGVVMKVGMHEPATPYEPERCRTWFRDLILGIEYLHAQGVVHRDIKPDNLLLTEDDTLKVVDFGVSEMFEKDSDFMTTKSAGSPAFLPPELCVSGHGKVSGRAADVWSMGVTLHCLYFGKVPFEKINPLELYESIREDDVDLRKVEEDDFRDLLRQLLEKDPNKRIQMHELREHPWITKRGTDPLLSAEENTADLVTPPTEEEMKRAITSKMSNLLVVMKAVKKFKSLISHRRPQVLESILGQHLQIVLPPEPMHPSRSSLQRSQSQDIDERVPIEQALAREGVHREIDVYKIEKELTLRDDAAVLGRHTNKPVVTKEHYHESVTIKNSSMTVESALYAAGKGSRPSAEEFQGKGQAHDPLSEDFKFLAVGGYAGEYTRTPQDSPPIVSESPGAAEDNIYETAYHEEVERIRQKSQNTTLYMTKRVQDKSKYKNDRNMLGMGEEKVIENFSKLVAKAKEAKNHRSAASSIAGSESDGEANLKSLIQEGGVSPTGVKKLTQAAVKDLKQVHKDKLDALDNDSRSQGMKRLAEATMADLKVLQGDKLGSGEGKQEDSDTGTDSGHFPNAKATVQEFKDAYHGKRAEQKSEAPDGGPTALKDAIREVREAHREKQATVEDEDDEGTTGSVVDNLKDKVHSVLGASKGN